MNKMLDLIRHYKAEDRQLHLFEYSTMHQEPTSYKLVREALKLSPDAALYRSNGKLFYFIDEDSVEQVNMSQVVKYHARNRAYLSQRVLPLFDEDQSIEIFSDSSVHIKTSTPPKRAEQLLLLILDKNARENLIGDLAEEFAEIETKHGERFAKVWYYKQVAASAWPLIQKALRWGILAWASEWIRRMI